MVFDYDVAIIGAGLLGCFTARNLARYNLKVAVFEKNCDVCTEVSRANTAIIYPGYDAVPGSLKARLCRSANLNIDRLCKELGVRLRRTGSLMVSFGPRGDRIIREKYYQGLQNEVGGLRLLTGPETRLYEPNINPAVTGALYAESTATVNPWELGIAAAENAVENGAKLYLETKITGIRAVPGGFALRAGGHDYTARAVVNCAGLYGDEVSTLLETPRFRLSVSAANYLLLDESCGGFVRHIIMHEPEKKGRGATLVPTVGGNILLGPSKEPSAARDRFETTPQGIEFVAETSKFVFPNLPIDAVIRSFASIRPSVSMVTSDSEGNITETGERLHDLLIYESDEHPGFISLAGIRTPGLTCCDEIGRHVTDMLLERLGNPGLYSDFKPERKRPVRFSELSLKEQAELAEKEPGYARIVCRCGKVTEGEIRASIRSLIGATTVDGVKRRTGALMGRCQGGFCTQGIIEILADELGAAVSEVEKDEKGSELLRNC